MHAQIRQSTNYLSRRFVLQSLVGLALTMSIDGCVQTASSPSATRPTPTPRPHGSLLYSYRGHTQRVTTVAWSPDGKYIASGSLDKTVQIWPTEGGNHVHPFTYRGHHDAIRSVSWSPDGQRLASGSYDTTLQIWDAFTGEHAIICRGHTNAVMTVAWSPDGKTIASGSLDATVRLWDVATGKQLHVYRGHTDSVNSLCWSPDSQHIVSGSSDTTAQILNTASAEHLFTYRGHSSTVSSVSWSPDGERIVSGSWDKTAQVWNATSGTLAYTYQGYNVKAAQTDSSKGVLPDLIFVVAWSHNGKRIAAVSQVYCGDNCGVIISWDADTGRGVVFYVDMPTFALAWSPDDTRYATAIEVTTQGNSMVKDVPKEDGSYAQIEQA